MWGFIYRGGFDLNLPTAWESNEVKCGGRKGSNEVQNLVYNVVCNLFVFSIFPSTFSQLLDLAILHSKTNWFHFNFSHSFIPKFIIIGHHFRYLLGGKGQKGKRVEGVSVNINFVNLFSAHNQSF